MNRTILAFAFAPTLLVLPTTGHAQGTMQTTANEPSAAAAMDGEGSAENDPDHLNRAEDWIGYPVRTSDGTVIGTLDSVSTQSPTPMLVVKNEDGTSTKVPLKGASEEGGSVTVPLTAAQLPR